MKNKLTILLLLLSSFCFAQQSRFKEGETIYVWAMSGLNMRKLPDAKSEKIAALPYGMKVIVQQNIGVIVAHEVEEFKDFKVKGYWLLVKYGDMEGFVFDGYMSRLVAPTNFDNFEEYFEKKAGTVGKKFDLRIYGDSEKGVLISEPTYNDEGQICGFSQKYKNGISLTTSTCNEVGVFYKIKCANLTLFEGYALLKKYIYQYKSILKFNNKNQSVHIETIQESGSCDFDIKIENGNLIISGGCAC